MVNVCERVFRRDTKPYAESPLGDRREHDRIESYPFFIKPYTYAFELLAAIHVEGDYAATTMNCDYTNIQQAGYHPLHSGHQSGSECRSLSAGRYAKKLFHNPPVT